MKGEEKGREEEGARAEELASWPSEKTFVHGSRGEVRDSSAFS
jgi:hypothetical protein